MTAQLRTQAEQALEQLKDTIFDYIKSKPQGVTSTDVVKDLNLYSDYEGGQKNFLSWSVLGILLGEGRIRYEKPANRKIYFVN